MAAKHADILEVLHDPHPHAAETGVGHAHAGEPGQTRPGLQVIAPDGRCAGRRQQQHRTLAVPLPRIVQLLQFYQVVLLGPQGVVKLGARRRRVAPFLFSILHGRI